LWLVVTGLSALTNFIVVSSFFGMGCCVELRENTRIARCRSVVK
jgi:hypothetical protein